MVCDRRPHFPSLSHVCEDNPSSFSAGAHIDFALDQEKNQHKSLLSV
jgi:hypothetical protein